MEVQQYYSMSEIVISGKNIPKPIVQFSEAVFPGNSLVFVVFYLIFQDWWKSPVLHVSCFLMWLDTHEPMYEAAISFIFELGCKISVYSGNPFDSCYFFYRVSMLIQVRGM